MGQVPLMRSFHFLTVLLSLLMVKQVMNLGSLCSGLKHQLYSAENTVLKNYVQKQKTVLNHVICGRDCSMDEDCKSFNFYEYKKLCELNNETRAEHPQDFIEHQGSVYFDADEATTHLSSPEPTTRSSSSKSPKPEYGTCKQLLNSGNTQSKVYSIYPGGIDSEALQVYCDMETDGGGWTVFQRRIDGSVDFNRTWAEYKSGFGDPSGEYWLGNDYLVSIPTQWDLRIDLEAWDGQTAYAKYQYSSITEENYRLNLGVASGPAGNSMYFGQIFTTRDKDNDNVYDKNCAEIYQGAWWFNHCSGGTKSNLNGAYRDASSLSSDGQGIWWETFKQESLKTCSMKLREVP